MTIEQIKQDLEASEQKAVQAAKDFVNDKKNWVKRNQIWLEAAGTVLLLALVGWWVAK